MNKRIILNRIKLVVLSTILYFCFDYLIQITGFLKFHSFVGLKSFLPITLALLFGIYGMIGEIIACSITCVLLNTSMNNVIMEYCIIMIPGIFAWISWHLISRTHKLHFRYVYNYVVYIFMVIIPFTICSFISLYLVDDKSFMEIIIWGISMSVLIGIPIAIIYSGLMCLNPILPPLKKNGKKIMIVDDVCVNLDSDAATLGIFNEKFEEFIEKENVNMKRVFEIENCIEEIYLRIIAKNKDTKIDLRTNYDITFSAEFIYDGEKFNPFYIDKNKDEADIASLTLIKHRALLASYSYNFGKNQIHIVI